MEVTQESILSLLIAEGGKVKNADMLDKFKGSLNCADPAEKKRNRELFKSFVNNVAFVKEIDGAKYIIVKKKYHHLLRDVHSKEGHRAGKGGNAETPLQPGERSPEEAGKCEDGGGESSVPGQEHNEGMSNCTDNQTESLSPIQLALQRSKMDFKLKRALNFDIVQNSEEAAVFTNETKPTSAHHKPYALPLRMPPSATRVEIHRLKGDPGDAPESPNPLDSDSFRNKRKPWMDGGGGGGGLGSPQPRRSVKSTKPSEEPKEPRFTSTVPLEQAEHEWLVKCATGHWSQVYGLLLRDNQLAEKRDFMSGFTALHWAAKCGNSEMLGKIIDISKKGGIDLDINAKAYGGYTPLHIAALHDQEFILAQLVGEYGADASIRDNCGKKAHHYLHKGASETVREMLGQSKVQPAQESAQHDKEDKEELDLFPDLSKGLHTISRLFQPHVTGHKKKHKQRPGFYSLNDEPREEREDSNGSKHRILSEVFM